MSTTIEVTLTETEINKLDGLSRLYANGNREELLSLLIRRMEHERRVASIRETRELMLDDLNGRTFLEDEIAQATKHQCD